MTSRLLVSTVLIVSLIFMLGCVSPQQNGTPAPIQNNVSNTSTQPDNTPTPPILPTSGTMSVSIYPVTPVAGDDVTVTAALLPEFDYPGWQNNTTYAIWIRQFGNWKVTTCSDSPCVASWDNVSTGNFEYQIRRTDSKGNETTDGAFSVTIEPAAKTGDTLGPKVVLFYDPGHPYTNKTITITASVNDVSKVDKTDIYLDGEIIKTCDVDSKILQCIATLNGVPAGDHALYAVAVDSFGNATKTDDLDMTVYAEAVGT